jgi:hypothetical protein
MGLLDIFKSEVHRCRAVKTAIPPEKFTSAVQ